MVDWTFETNTVSGTAATNTYGAADTGAQTGGSSASGTHAGATTAWSSPAGNGSAKSYSSHWAAGDYWQFQLSTVGDQNLVVSFDQTGSTTGPRDFKLQYSTNGTSYTDLTGGAYSVLLSTWAGTSPPRDAAFTHTFDLSSVTALNNQTNVFFALLRPIRQPLMVARSRRADRTGWIISKSTLPRCRNPLRSQEVRWFLALSFLGGFESFAVKPRKPRAQSAN